MGCFQAGVTVDPHAPTATAPTGRRAEPDWVCQCTLDLAVFLGELELQSQCEFIKGWLLKSAKYTRELDLPFETYRKL